MVDAGPLYADVDADDRDHLRTMEFLDGRVEPLVLLALVVIEVAHLMGAQRDHGAVAVRGHNVGMTARNVCQPHGTDWGRYLDRRESRRPVSGRGGVWGRDRW